MIISTRKTFSGLSLAVILCLPALPAQSSESNVITITGQILPDPCVVSPERKSINVSCSQDGKKQTRQVSYREASLGNPVNAGGADISMKYLTPEKKLAIIQVSYR